MGLNIRFWLIIGFITATLLLFTATTLDQDRLPVEVEGGRKGKVAEISTATINESVQPTEQNMKGPNLVDEKTKKAVEEYFKDNPILVHIAFCESSFRQNGKDGEVLRGNVIAKDVGVMQINERFHAAQAEKLGYDIHTLEGNLGYAKWLYEKEGARPWMSSSKCWTARANHEIALR